MSYDEETVNRILRIISSWDRIERKKMFGGVCYLEQGKMFCGVYKNYLILRLGEKGAREALKGRYAKPFDITGRPMKGWVMVQKQGFAEDEELLAWLEEAREFAGTLQPAEDAC